MSAEQTERALTIQVVRNGYLVTPKVGRDDMLPVDANMVASNFDDLVDLLKSKLEAPIE